MDELAFKVLALSTISAMKENAFLTYLKALQETDLPLFLKSIYKAAQDPDGPKGRAFVESCGATTEELIALLRENGYTVDEIREVAAAVGTTGPTSEELLLAAFKEISVEHPTWKPFQFRRFVESHMNQHLTPTPKPFTNEVVTIGAKWYLNEIKNIKAERAKTNSRPRPRVHIDRKRWIAFYRLREWGDKPIFAEQFKKAVRERVRQLRKRETAQTSTN